jgi:hypothetical protein
VGGLWRLLSAHYKGVVMAKLPFEPFSITRRLTHSGLEGEDWSQCGFHFIYVLGSMAVRGMCMKFVNRDANEAMSKALSPQWDAAAAAAAASKAR